jgi:hypothetical protein
MTVHITESGESPLAGPFPATGYMSPEDLLPRVDLDAIIRRISRQTTSSEENVEARLFLLSEDKAVLLDAADDASALVLDFEQDQSSRQIRRIPTGEIESGMFVLLRSAGAGDFIIEIADRILGEECRELREAQQLWKKRLHDTILSAGKHRVCARLRERGSLIASEVNLHNWVSYRSIRTRNRSDFSAIMSVTGLAGQDDEIWNKMGMIDSAHRSAGHRIRLQLLEMVSRLDMQELRIRTRFDFTLPDVEAGTLSAFLVESAPDSRVPVSVTQLGKVFDREAVPTDQLGLDF